MLLTHDKFHGDKCPEQKDARLKPRPGELKQINIESDLMILPLKVTPFVSRNQDMFDVLRLLANNNVVQIYGMPGLGKSSLLKNVTCFLGERDIYKDGVVYIDFLHVTTFRDAIQIINAYLNDNQDENLYLRLDQDELLQEVDTLKRRISRFSRKFLFSMDNIHHLDKDSHEKFLTFLNEIVSPRHVKVLFASNKFSIDCFSEGFSVKKIQKLKKHESVDLFIKKIPLGDGDKK